MWRRKLALTGFVIGVSLGACVLNVPPGDEGAFTYLASVSATPLLLLLSPVLILLPYTGGFLGHAVSATVSWTLLGFLAGAVADRKRPARR